MHSCFPVTSDYKALRLKKKFLKKSLDEPDTSAKANPLHITMIPRSPKVLVVCTLMNSALQHQSVPE